MDLTSRTARKRIPLVHEVCAKCNEPRCYERQGEFTKAVDGAVQRKIKPDRDEGPMKAFRDKINE